MNESSVILFQVIRHLKRVLPSGPQRKREVDYVLDRISETMTPMHYHSREVIFSTFNLVSNVKKFNDGEVPCGRCGGLATVIVVVVGLRLSRETMEHAPWFQFVIIITSSNQPTDRPADRPMQPA